MNTFLPFLVTAVVYLLPYINKEHLFGRSPSKYINQSILLLIQLSSLRMLETQWERNMKET